MRSQGLSKCFIILAFLLLVGAGIAEARKEIRIVGSVAVLPFMESIAENFALHWDYPPPSIEDTGAGRAFRLFGAGAGYQYPDMVVTPRPITPAEWAFCQKHGVGKGTEIIIGYDAIAFVNLKTSPRLNVTVPQLFNAEKRSPSCITPHTGIIQTRLRPIASMAFHRRWEPFPPKTIHFPDPSTCMSSHPTCRRSPGSSSFYMKPPVNGPSAPTAISQKKVSDPWTTEAEIMQEAPDTKGTTKNELKGG